MKIVAVGNSFYGDDGIGAAVLDRIRESDAFPGAELVDIQTDALALIDELIPDEWNVVIDAADMGLSPGSALGFRPSEVALKIRGDHLSLHGFGLAEAFSLAVQLGRLPRRVLIVGVQPEKIEINQGLTATVAAAVPQVISIIRAEVVPDEREDHSGH
jgi:hydrogenase maturation protease